MEIKKFEKVFDPQSLYTQQLAEASKEYYGTGQSSMSDHEFDRKLEQLRKMEEKSGYAYDISPTIKVGADAVTELKKVKHEHPALSLDKLKYAEKEKLRDFVTKAPDGCVALSWKNDGLTIEATYDDGKLVMAATRGDGYEGNDVTHNAKYFKGLPQEIAYKGHLVARGEAVMSTAEFERVNVAAGGIYENPRNLAAATVQMLDANESKQREIRFIGFQLVEPEPKRDRDSINNRELLLSQHSDRLKWLRELGFNVVEFVVCNESDILEKVDEWKEKLDQLDYPTDGLVITYDDMIYGMSLGATGHHFRHSIALKWTDETKETTIRDIEWSVGKTGIITPVAIFDTVRLGLGSNVTRASLHNISIMENLGVKMNSKAHVYLANMIIPQVTDVSGGDCNFILPATCPICGECTSVTNNNGVKVLHCDNPHCSARQIGNLMNTFGKDGLYVKGLGESQIEDLMEYGIVGCHPVDFYNMAKAGFGSSEYRKRVEKLLKKDGWGEKKWQNLIDAINESRETTLQKFLYSLNVPLLGNDLSKKLAKLWHNNIEEFKEFFENPSVQKLLEIEGIGEEKANNVVDWCNHVCYDRCERLLLLGLIDELHFPEPVVVQTSGQTLEGLTFVITGNVHDYKNRAEFTASVEARGGKVAGSVSKNTNFLVNNDVTSTSGKNKKAKELGIEIISEDEFISRYGR